MSAKQAVFGIIRPYFSATTLVAVLLLWMSKNESGK
ncbi:hypothetical protein VAA_02257 [Vibrio anguillarum 775]|nr:hypothetical protein VAA_02257 [Vibrio anguillarum 775]